MNSTIERYNRNLAPFGLRIEKYGTRGFIMKYKNGKANLRVNTRPNKYSANLAAGGTHPNYQGKGIATAIRILAVSLLKNAGFTRVTHQGVNYNGSRKNGVPVTTYIVRKYLGFRPRSKNNSNFRSYWHTSGIYSNSMLKKLNKAKPMALNILRRQA